MPKKTFQHKNGEIKSYSNKKLKCNKLEQIEVSLMKDELEKIESHNYNLFIRDNKIVFQEKDELKLQKGREEEKKEFDNLIAEIKKGKHKELAPIFEKIINQKSK